MIFKLALAYLQIIGDDLLNLDMEAMLCYMQHTAPQKIEEDPVLLFNQAGTIKINAKLMKKLEKEYSLMKSNELEVEIELRRLRTENGILLQRIDRLETENIHLTEKLVEEQMQRAADDAKTGELKRQFSLLRQQCRRSLVGDDVDAIPQPLLPHADRSESPDMPATPVDCKSNTEGFSFSSSSISDAMLHEMDFTSLKNHVAMLNKMLQEIQEKCNKLEEENSLLSRNPSNEVATLQEELIAAKLREAESSLNMNEMRKRLIDLEKMYASTAANNVETSNSFGMKTSTSLFGSALKGLTSNSTHISQLNEEISRLKLRNASLHAEVTELKQTTMEVETQNQLSSRQLRRQDEEVQKIRDQLEASLSREKQLISELKTAQHLITDIETQRKEDLHNFRLRETEISSQLAEDRLITRSSRGVNVPSSHDHDVSIHSSGISNTQKHEREINEIWKNLPAHMMTESIGPLEDLCFLPNDPMITSIYVDQSNSSNADASEGEETADRSDGASTPVVDEESTV